MTQWQKMTPEQKKAQMERNTYYRHKRKAAELGISLEEYRASLSSPKPRKVKEGREKVAVPDDEEDFGWTQYNPEGVKDYPETKIIHSDLRPWITFHMKRHVFSSRHGDFVGYKVDHIEVDAELEKLSKINV